MTDPKIRRILEAWLFITDEMRPDDMLYFLLYDLGTTCTCHDS